MILFQNTRLVEDDKILYTLGYSKKKKKVMPGVIPRLKPICLTCELRGIQPDSSVVQESRLDSAMGLRLRLLQAGGQQLRTIYECFLASEFKVPSACKRSGLSTLFSWQFLNVSH